MSRITLDMDQPSPHFAADPASGVPGDMNLAAAHLTAQVSARRTVNMYPAGPHVRPNPMNAGHISFPIASLVTRIARNREHFGERYLAIAVTTFESLNFSQR